MQGTERAPCRLEEEEERDPREICRGGNCATSSAKERFTWVFEGDARMRGIGEVIVGTRFRWNVERKGIGLEGRERDADGSLGSGWVVWAAGSDE
jgi:hypothetical protein